MQDENVTKLMEHAEKFGEVTVHALKRGSQDSVTFLSIPEGRSVRSAKHLLDEYLDVPERKVGTAEHCTLQSFIDHVKRFSDEGSAVFAQPHGDEPSLTCVLDYHEPNSGSPRWGQHRGRYSFPVSDEWQTWSKIDGESLTISQFSEFVEEHVHDVIAPEAAGANASALAVQLGTVIAAPTKLIELARGLDVRVGQRVASSQNLSSGEGEIVFSEQHTDAKGQPLRVPSVFVIGIPVFRAGELYQVPVRLRYRSAGGSITWKMILHRTDACFTDAVQQAAEKAATDTGLPLFWGKPE